MVTKYTDTHTHTHTHTTQIHPGQRSDNGLKHGHDDYSDSFCCNNFTSFIYIVSAIVDNVVDLLSFFKP